jgi:hypothetical protein
MFMAFILICAAAASAGCNSGELSRSKVRSLIEASPDFVQPATVSLSNRYETEPSNVSKTFTSETVEQAKARDLKSLLDSYPDMEAANQLGYTDIEQTFIKEVPYIPGSDKVPGWYLTRKVRANEKGKQLWQEMKLPVDDKTLPVGRKEFIDVTGITKQGGVGGGGEQAIADFTYQWQPNELGRALDEHTEEFQKLSEDVRKRLSRKTGLFQTADSTDWSGVRQGKAIFQKYDDGWRLVKIF